MTSKMAAVISDKSQLRALAAKSEQMIGNLVMEQLKSRIKSPIYFDQRAYREFHIKEFVEDRAKTKQDRPGSAWLAKAGATRRLIASQPESSGASLKDERSVQNHTSVKRG